jgi:hypothetical protein
MLEVESPNTLPNIFIAKFSYIIFFTIEVDFRGEINKKWN